MTKKKLVIAVKTKYIDARQDTKWSYKTICIKIKYQREKYFNCLFLIINEIFNNMKGSTTTKSTCLVDFVGFMVNQPL